MTAFLDQLFGLERHSVITALDVEYTVLALFAVGVFWFLDRRDGRNAERGVIGYAVIWLQYFFGVHAFISGATYFVSPEQQMIMENDLAGPLQYSLDATGLFAVVKVIETVVGACLILNIFVPIAAIFEMPISVIIFYLSVFIVADHRTIWTGPKELIANGVLLLAYWGYFRPLFAPYLRWRPVWREKIFAAPRKLEDRS
jgi:hypothetical protein